MQSSSAAKTNSTWLFDVSEVPHLACLGLRRHGNQAHGLRLVQECYGFTGRKAQQNMLHLQLPSAPNPNSAYALLWLARGWPQLPKMNCVRTRNGQGRNWSILRHLRKKLEPGGPTWNPVTDHKRPQCVFTKLQAMAQTRFDIYEV